MRANQGSRAAPDVYGRNLGIKYGAEDAPFILTLIFSPLWELCRRPDEKPPIVRF
jgi:hypothetical protein